jgi:hypothetical protein
MPHNSKDDLVCLKPFYWLDAQPQGECYVCCPAWLSKSIGNLTPPGATVESVWNSEAAQEIRKSILDGSFRHCDRNLCPELQHPMYHVVRKSELPDDEVGAAIRAGKTSLPYRPKRLNLSYDRSCNLACPSCRTDFYSARGEELISVRNIQDKIVAESANDVVWISVTGSGDPFGSSTFRKLLARINRGSFPNLKQIHLHTNAQLWTPEVWNGFPALKDFLISAEISIDAADAPTYASNRKGGNWERLVKNLEFIKSLQLANVTLSFVVQANNYAQMPRFAEMGRALGFRVYFGQLVNWGTYEDADFESRAVSRPKHPEHAALLKTLSHPFLHKPHVSLGNLTDA